MKRLLFLLLPLSLSAHLAGAQGLRVSVAVIDTVEFEALLLPGAPTTSLQVYSPKAAAGRGEFIFENVRVGALGYCRYRLSCRDGIITAVDLTSRSADVPAGLEAVVQQHYGIAQQENMERRGSEINRRHFEYRQGKASASLDILKSAGWNFSARKG